LMGAASSSGGPADVEAVVPPEIPRGGPHELGSKLPHTDGEKGT
jgi:hypothetical protein